MTDSLKKQQEEFLNGVAKINGLQPYWYAGFVCGVEAFRQSPEYRALIEALEYIACEGARENLMSARDWLEVSQLTCAETIAEDTKLARETLAAIRGDDEKEK